MYVRKLDIWPFVCLFTFCLLPVCLSVCLPICLPVTVCLCVCLSACLYVCLSACLLVCQSVCLWVCQSVCLSVCLSVCCLCSHSTGTTQWEHPELTAVLHKLGEMLLLQWCWSSLHLGGHQCHLCLLAGTAGLLKLCYNLLSQCQMEWMTFSMGHTVQPWS